MTFLVICPQVTYKTFVPCQIARRQYETQRDSLKRMLAWINATGEVHSVHKNNR